MISMPPPVFPALSADASLRVSSRQLQRSWLAALCAVLCGCLFLAFAAPVFPQNTAPNEWTWMGGSSTPNQSGIYGTLGVPAPSNNPGGRYLPAIWIDGSGNHWIFGGVGYDYRGAQGYLNDLWEQSASSGEWTWMGGSNTAGLLSVYGTFGVPAAENIPGGRGGAVTWIDSGGNLWLFGGKGISTAGSASDLNDLWEFSPTTLEWTWMGGSTTPAHAGSLGVPAVGNIPSIRDTAVGWTDANGNLWLFGGEDSVGGAGNYGFTNDLWEFNPAAGEWAWMGGNPSQPVRGVYGASGILSSNNFPGSRAGATLWTDSFGNRWLFGGNGLDANWSQGLLNDVWQFNSSDQEWVWMAGNEIEGTAGLYGTPGQPAPGNHPGGRGIGASWIDTNGNLWILGGEGLDSTGKTGFLNDLWQFNPVTHEWAWMGGSNVIGSSGSQPGVYGTLGTPASGNMPGGRMGAASWTDNNGNLWLFGGVGTSSTGADVLFNDLWEYRASASVLPPAAMPTFSVAPGTYYASAMPVSISDATAGATIYYTTDGTPLTTSSAVYSGPITVSATETLKAFAVAAGYSQSSISSAVYILKPPAAATPAFNLGSGTYIGEQTVTLSDATPGATIYFTTNGVSPTPWSSLYTGPLTVSSPETIQAIAVATGYSESDVAAATYTITSPAATEAWAWMGGSSVLPTYEGLPGVYGTLGSPAIGNTPGGRFSAATWTDSSGNLWLFGGYSPTVGASNDLWEFNPATDEWAWMGGSSTMESTTAPAGVYGTLGVPATGNVPGGRYQAVSWTDSAGNFWLFGGAGVDSTGASGFLNDLWEFSPSTNEWTWMSGASTISGNALPGVYGQLGVPAASNVPGGRWEATGWIDGSGNLWLFGGYGLGYSGSYLCDLNDLWRFTPSTNEWTWMGGSNSTNNGYCQQGVYGILGVPAAGNVPGSREEPTSWTDRSGNLWLFGGWGNSTSYSGQELNDLWEFTPSTNLWTWMGGSNQPSQSAGVYGVLRVPGATNVPGGRMFAAGWTDGVGNLWLFGGYGAGSSGGGELNDLWQYNLATHQWAWMGGSSTVPDNGKGTGGQAGVYGVLGVPDTGNSPGGRDSALAWTDRSGNLWLFGGEGYDSADTYGYLNDLWEFQPVLSTLPAAAPSFSIAAGSYATAQTVAISDATPGAIICYTSDGSTPTASSMVYSGAITVSSSETLQAIAVASGYSNSSVASAAYTIMQTPAITWGTPAAITYGTALGASQLNASATVAGTFSYSPATGAVLAAGQQTLTVTFTPTDTTDYTSATASVTLTVNQATPTITWTTPAAITYGTPVSAAQLNATASVAGTFTYSPAAGTVLTVGQQTLTATFTPTDATDYTTATATVTLTVNQATPTITWATPAAITYGTPLSAAQLNATASVAGTFTYSPAAGTVLNAGTQTLTATFTPTDTTDYTPATASVTLTVNEATPAITWATPAPINYGTPLSAIQLDASSTVAGTFTYSPAAGTVLGAGQQTLTATFMPTDSTDYTPASATVTLTVNKATPTITWATPKAITYGTPLSAIQLNATASVAGSFTYLPAAGTVLTAGSQTLTVTFAPTDSTDYTPASASVTLTVNKATPTITWATPAAITYGTALSATQLDAKASVPGTFFYSPAAGTVPAFGTDTLTATFTPTDTTDYTTATDSVTLTVNPAPSFTLAASPASLTVTQGASGKSTIAVTALNGFTGEVTLAASGLPSGVTASFATNPTTGTSVLTLAASNTAVTGTYNVTIKGTSGSLTATTTIALTVNGFACHIGYTIESQWKNGFEAAITINNTGVKSISNWTLTWTFANGQKITSIWDGTDTQSGANVTVTNTSFNGSIPAGGSYNGLGFNASWNNTTNAVPTSFAVNGTTCK
jgi:N-acetylneuraminic acid mutarotase